MAELSSGSIKIPGLGNGTDFHTMIDELEKIEMSRAIQLNNWKTDWNKRLAAFKQVQAAMVEYSSAMKKLNSVDKFMIKTVNISTPGVCNATATGSADNVSHTINVKQKATQSYSSVVFNLDNKLDKINNTSTTQTFTFTLGDPSDPLNTKTLDIPPGCTLEGFKNLINQNFGSPTGDTLGMKATIIDVGNGQQMLQFYSTKTGENTDITIEIDDVNPSGNNNFWSQTNSSTGKQFVSNAPIASSGQDAWVRIDGWPTLVADNADPAYPKGEDNPDSWLKVSNNTLTHIPGLTITLTGTGETVVDIDLDTESIRENIFAFVDATNALRTLLKEYTDYDATKQTTTSDYADSQFETQKGGVLQGNYGMQLMMSKMKTLIMSKPTGFDYLQKDANGNVLSGDVFSSLAQIGIKTDASQGSATCGLLIFEDNISVLTDGKVEMITFDDALRMNAENVAELFAADCDPSVDGTNFGYNSHVSGFTRAGTYNVEYECNPDGSIAWATINGKAAYYYADTGQIGLRSQDGSPNDADGILLDLYNTTPGVVHDGTIRLKSGFLPQLVTMLDRDFLDPDSGKQDLEKGTLSVLISQYQKIIDGINDKIAREDERLIKWRRMMELRFANLEATLKVYSGLQEQLEAQVNAMSSSKS